ncbi:uncharacterized protein (TIGR02246 family) [Mycolicibacterium sp. BK634]|uniref:SgcJ/EcaC family oxidoreductase n=1 Tax=Mycolicibacterium sp. BK634 TaxID=2587099 RepID=UPI00161411D6|nr:SgcJ/EcaC family oxidoreductase [Mycolicibacterium sp. BK634]MBB3748880.1 uncharacterized protein (TIGR02246 family) [Mycolicibacterium sp. BK634]
MSTAVKVPGIEDPALILREVLDQWKSGIGAHDPQSVAAAFTDDAIFQGLRPYTVGPQGVFDYYNSQPAGMTVDYRLLECRRLGDDVALGYVAALFTFPERDPVDLRLGVVAVRTDSGWRISYYQASPAPG